MGHQPLLATHRLTMQYRVQGIDHAVNFHMDAVATATADASGYDAVSHTVSIADVGCAALIATLKALMAPLYNTEMAWVDWTLYHWVSPNFIPLYSAALSGNGTEATAITQKCAQFTCSFRSGLYELAKIVLFETYAGAPQHGSSFSGVHEAWFAAFTDHAAGKPGNYVVAKDDTRFNTRKFFTVSLNKRLRRERNLV